MGGPTVKVEIKQWTVPQSAWANVPNTTPTKMIDAAFNDLRNNYILPMLDQLKSQVMTKVKDSDNKVVLQTRIVEVGGLALAVVQNIAMMPSIFDKDQGRRQPGGAEDEGGEDEPQELSPDEVDKVTKLLMGSG